MLHDLLAKRAQHTVGGPGCQPTIWRRHRHRMQHDRRERHVQPATISDDASQLRGGGEETPRNRRRELPWLPLYRAVRSNASGP